jgi:hypothetical protein
MKMIALTFIISLFCSVLTAPPNHAEYILQIEAIMPFEPLWLATCEVETHFKPYAIGDKQLKKHSFGIVQIRESRLRDYNKKTNSHYTIKDLFNPEISKKIFMYYCQTTDLEVVARSWNGGKGGMNNKKTIKYWNLIKSKL